MDLLGDRWSLLVVRELMTGPKRFSQIAAALDGVSANVLTQRLGDLANAGVLFRERLPPPASVSVYRLTDWGLEAEPILKELGRWASRSPTHDPTLPFSNASLMLSMRTMFQPERCGDGTAALILKLGDETFEARVAEGALRVAPGRVGSCDAMVAGTARGIAAWIYMDVSPQEAGLTVSGDSDRAAWFAGLFALPEKAPLPRIGEARRTPR